MNNRISVNDVSQQVSLTEIRYDDLYFCYEYRIVAIREKEIALTAKEFDILALLIMNPKRVFTYEMITDYIWGSNSDFYSRKTIITHIGNIRKKLKVAEDIPDYIKSVHSVGYKFDF